MPATLATSWPTDYWPDGVFAGLLRREYGPQGLPGAPAERAAPHRTAVAGAVHGLHVAVYDERLSARFRGDGHPRSSLSLRAGPTPNLAYLRYQVACCESLAGRTDDAIEQLRHAIDGGEGCRGMAIADSDFDPIRDDPSFQELTRAGAGA